LKWALRAVSTYAAADPGEDAPAEPGGDAAAELGEDPAAELGGEIGAARKATAAAIQPANSTIPTTIGQRISLGGV